MQNDLFADLDAHTSDDSDIIKAPFGYTGGKSRSIKNIIRYLPYTDKYISVFGGSGTDILARHRVKLEVFNDKYSGLIAFYRCIRDKKRMEELVTRLEYTLHSREEFEHCKDTWETCDNDVEKAARWYYMIKYSFNSLGRNFGRILKPGTPLSNKFHNILKEFPAIHERFKYVQIENQDWYDCLIDYDSPNAVFYMDPPYVNVHSGTYKYDMSIKQHQQMLEVISTLEGFVALSGYPNPLYDEQTFWDDVQEWEVLVTSSSGAYNERNHMNGLKHLKNNKSKTVERLWIKEAK